jgi:pseudouridine synthase
MFRTTGAVSRCVSLLSLPFILVLWLMLTDTNLALSTSGGRNLGRTVVLLYNKPPNVVTTHAVGDVKNRSNVFDDIRTMRGYVGQDARQALTLEQATGVESSEWNAIGRLDADTTGLLLLTNDGGLVHHVTNKNAETNTRPIGKTYEAQIMGYHEENDSPLLEEVRLNGVDIGVKYGGRTQPVPDIAVIAHPTPKTTLVSLTLYEGKNRQIRRMFHALGSGVMKLKRTAIGEKLSVAGLEEGQWHILSDEEVIAGLHWEPRLLESRGLHHADSRRSNARDSMEKSRPGKRRRRKR